MNRFFYSLTGLFRVAFCLPGLAVVLMGCSDGPGDSSATTETNDQVAATENTTAAGGQGDDTSAGPGATPTDAGSAVSLEIASWEAVQAEIKTHVGKVVVVDVWSTSCIPCMRELPHLADLQRQHGEQLVAITVNIDYIGLEDEPPSALEAKALEFLESRQISARNFLCSDPDEEVLKQIPAGSIPVVLVYQATGELAKQFDDSGGEFTYEKDVIPAVTELLVMSE